MIGAGTVINPIIKIVTTVVILGAVYLFFVKPALDTTEDITDRAFESVPNASEILEGIPDSSNLQRQIQDSFDEEHTGNVNTDKLLRCVQNANQDVEWLQRCTNRFGP